MLQEIKVKNFAIIEDIEVKFNNKMTVLTGQTGAGKSLIIDALSLILGARADLDMIRYGESESMISATFTNLPDFTVEAINNLGYQINSDLIITRIISNSGKNVIKVNNQNITLNLDSTRFLIDNYVQKIFPVGSIYMSFENISPELLFKIGKWEKIIGRFLYCDENSNRVKTLKLYKTEKKQKT